MKHIAKRGFSLGLALLMLLLCLSACKPEETDPSVEPKETESEAATETEASSETESEESDTEPVPLAAPYDLNTYILIRPDGANETVTEIALNMITSLGYHSILMDIGNDWVAAGDEEKTKNARELLVGKTIREETQLTLEEMPEDQDYAIRFFDHKIVVVGRNDESLQLAVTKFILDYVKKAKAGVLEEVKEGDVEYGTDPALDVVLNPRGFNDYPKFNRSYDEAKTCNNDVIQYLYGDVAAGAIDEYINRLKEDGFTLAQDTTVGINRTATLMKGEGMVHLAYQGSAKSLVVTSDYMASKVYEKPAEGSWEKLTDNSFSIMTMDYSQYSCKAPCPPMYDNNGLSYVITLEDGRYIIYDGGYAAPNDATILYEYLVDNNKREGKPVIAAWILTHSHADHYGAFLTFTSNYAKEVVVENLVANTGAGECYTGGHDTTLEALGAYGKTYYGGAAELQPHIGQKMYFCNVEIEVLYTHEMFHFDGDLTNENSASLVTRIYIDGMTLLITADAGSNTNIRMVKLFGDYLKSDFLQVAHHGNGGAREELLAAADPSYALWTTSAPGFRRRTYGVTYSVGMPSSYDAALNKKTFEKVGGTREGITVNGAENNWCADGPVEIMTFGPNKEIHIEYYYIREELLPNNQYIASDEDLP